MSTHSPMNIPGRGLLCWLCLCLGVWGEMAAASGATPTLTTALQVRSMTPEAAAQKLPVELRGTVVFIEGPNGAIVIQDETAGTYFHGRDERSLRIGDQVIVKGVTTPGSYLPGIELAQYENLGRRELPQAIPATYADLATGRYFFQRVMMEGIVQAVTTTPDESRSILSLAMGQDVLEVRICAPPKDRPLVDSRVRIECLASGAINQRRQLVQPIAWMHDWHGLQVLEPAPAESAIPLLSGSRLLAFGASGEGGHQVRVSGTIIAAFPEGEVFVRDETTALRLQLQRPAPDLEPAMQIEAMGFPKMQRVSAALVNVRIIRQEPGTAPAAIECSLHDLLKGGHDNDLIRVDAEVSGSFRTEEGHMLVLHEGGKTLRARVPLLTQELTPGTRVRLTGICLIEAGTASGVTSTPSAVHLRCRTTADVEVLSAPAWWTAQRLMLVAAVLLFTVMLATLWITLLRRQVHRQTQTLRQQIEHEAALEERQRIAREFHDTLEQGLTGLALRLDTARACSSDEKSGRLLGASRRLVAQIHEETRSLVSSLRQPCRERMDLATELLKIVDEHASGTLPELELQTNSEIPSLPSHIVHHLKMIAREAVTNALKHASARHIRLLLTMKEDHLQMTISDDGTGFDHAAEHRKNNNARFGCTGIEERCEKLGATVIWHSAPDQGTTVEVKLRLDVPPETSPR